MPSKYVTKEYVSQGIYHVYNRGVEKRDIFLDDYDYKYFLWLLKTYLSPQKRPEPEEYSPVICARPNFFNEIELLAFCLMPNHYHLLIKQNGTDSMSRFMKCLATNYSMYFNRNHDRVGKLYQGHYKAILVSDDNYFLHLSRYIHLNPVAVEGWHPAKGVTLTEELSSWWSSYEDYLGSRDTGWVKPSMILDLMDRGIGTFGSKHSSYKEFVEDYHNDSSEVLGGLTIE